MPEPPSQEVVNRKEINGGVELELKDQKGEEETRLFASDEKVMQSLNIEDLKENMKVKLEIFETPSGGYAQRIVIV